MRSLPSFPFLSSQVALPVPQQEGSFARGILLTRIATEVRVAFPELVLPQERPLQVSPW